MIWAFDCDPDDRRLANRRVFSDEKLPGFCDGSAIDAEGYLWNARFAGGAVVRFAPDGRVERIIELPVTNPTSCCFGGPDLTTLYVTSARFGLSQEQLAAQPAGGCAPRAAPGRRRHALASVCGLREDRAGAIASGADRERRAPASSRPGRHRRA